MSNPDEVLTNNDSDIYEKLMKKKLLIPDGVDEFQYVLNQHKKTVHNNDFLRLIILPTLSCNLNCPYCYETNKNSKMEDEVVRKVKSYLKKKIDGLETLLVSWFGGEPLLYPGIIQDIGTFASKLAHKKDVEFRSTITTNGTLLTEDEIKVLEETEVREMQVTLDGYKSTHNQKRIPVDGSGTYDQMVTNVKNYLDYNPKSSLVLRVHIHSVDQEEVNGIRRIFDEFYDHRDQMRIYFRQLFSSCTEGWDRDLVNETQDLPDDRVSDKKDDQILTLYEEAIEEDFRIYFGKSLSSCYADYDSCWVIKPDGLLHKCTVALEEDRSLGRLTENGVKYFWDRYTTWQKRSSDDFDREEIRNCSVFPLSWGKCPYSKYQNPDQTSNCREIKNSIRTKEKLLGIKSRYVSRRGE